MLSPFLCLTFTWTTTLHGSLQSLWREEGRSRCVCVCAIGVFVPCIVCVRGSDCASWCPPSQVWLTLQNEGRIAHESCVCPRRGVRGTSHRSLLLDDAHPSTFTKTAAVCGQGITRGILLKALEKHKKFRVDGFAPHFGRTW